MRTDLARLIKFDTSKFKRLVKFDMSKLKKLIKMNISKLKLKLRNVAYNDSDCKTFSRCIHMTSRISFLQ